jgi:hypothetical protein
LPTKNPAKKIAAAITMINTTPAMKRAQAGNTSTVFGRGRPGGFAESMFVADTVGSSWNCGVCTEPSLVVVML